MKRIFTIIIGLVVLFSLLSCAGGRPVLHVFNWAYYIAPEVLRMFEREYGVRVVQEFYCSNENMLVKVQVGGNAYDIIVPSGDHVSIMIELGLLMRIDKEKLTNYAYLNPYFLEQSRLFDPNNDYSIPYFWGSNGIIYNRRFLEAIGVGAEEMHNVSWGIFADERFAGRNVISFLDDMREVLGVALIYNGFTANCISEEALAAAEATLLQWVPNVSQFDSEAFRNEVQDGTILLGMAYNGDALQVMADNPDVGFVLPREGSTLWMDFLVIPANAPNPELAHKFINFLLRPDVGLINTKFVQYATPNLAVYELLPEEMRYNVNIYPTYEFLYNSSFIKDIGADIASMDRVWQLIRHLR